MQPGSEKSKESGGTNLDAVIGRAIRDEEFRKKITSEPDVVAREYNLLPQELITLKNITHEVADEFFSKVSAGRRIMYCTSKTCNETG